MVAEYVAVERFERRAFDSEEMRRDVPSDVGVPERVETD
jgi:hypothetical protein